MLLMSALKLNRRCIFQQLVWSIDRNQILWFIHTFNIMLIMKGIVIFNLDIICKILLIWKIFLTFIHIIANNLN